MSRTLTSIMGATMKPKLNYARTCLHCKHLRWDDGCCGYSEMTPTSAPTLSCRKKHFDDSIRGGCGVNLVDLLKQGNECNDFEDVDDEDK